MGQKIQQLLFGTVPNFGSVISTVFGSGDGFFGSITSSHGIPQDYMKEMRDLLLRDSL